MSDLHVRDRCIGSKGSIYGVQGKKNGREEGGEIDRILRSNYYGVCLTAFCSPVSSSARDRLGLSVEFFAEDVFVQRDEHGEEQKPQYRWPNHAENKPRKRFLASTTVSYPLGIW